MKRESKQYLADILEAISRVKEYTSNLNLNQLPQKKMVLDAVMRNLEIIGEAVAQLSPEVKESNPEVPWRDIKDFRNVVAHRYFSIDFEPILDIIKNKLNPLEQQIREILIKLK